MEASIPCFLKSLTKASTHFLCNSVSQEYETKTDWVAARTCVPDSCCSIQLDYQSLGWLHCALRRGRNRPPQSTNCLKDLRQGASCLHGKSEMASPFSTIMVCNESMAANKPTRRNTTLLPLETRQQKERAFFELAKRFRCSNDPAEVKQLGDE